MLKISNTKQLVWLAVIVFLLLTLAFLGSIMSHVQQANYRVVQTDKNFEIRDYATALVAQVDIQDERQKALKEGFRIIADFIFGNNIANEKIAMTAPVILQGQEQTWQVRFVMPSGYTLKNLPKPKNDAIKIISLSNKRFASIRFSGAPNSEDLKKNLDTLLIWVNKYKLTVIGNPIYAFYNPPWTLPFLRRNEVMIEIEK